MKSIVSVSERTYKGTMITRTEMTTDTPKGVRSLFRLAGAVNKSEGLPPLITTFAEAKDYITEATGIKKTSRTRRLYPHPIRRWWSPKGPPHPDVNVGERRERARKKPE